MSQSSTRFFSRQNLLFLAILLLFNGIVAYQVIVNGSDIHRENHLLENLQAAVLMLASIVFVASAYTVKGLHRRLAAFFAVLSFIFFFRELDIEKFDVPQGIVFLLADNRGRSVFFVALLFLLGTLIKDWRFFASHRQAYLRSHMFAFVSLSAVLLIVFSTVFDQKLVHVREYILYEELSEFSAYYLLLVTAVTSLGEFRQISTRLHKLTPSGAGDFTD